jgi:undecaprenyl-diphosphatase
MTFFSVIIISIIEGITEFLPISSTGHMIIVSDWLHLEQDAKIKAFEIMIQLAAILAIVLIYRSRINLKNKNLWFKTLVAFLPLGIIGFLFGNFFETLFTIKLVAINFIIGGIALLFAEKIFQKTHSLKMKTLNNITFNSSLKIGFFQVLALFPGMSRSAMTILGGMVSGLNRRISSEFSFLLAIPVMSATFVYSLSKNYSSLQQEDILFLSLGFIITFIVTFITVKLFLKFLEKFTLFSFGIYRIIFGLLLLWIYAL